MLLNTRAEIVTLCYYLRLRESLMVHCYLQIIWLLRGHAMLSATHKQEFPSG